MSPALAASASGRRYAIATPHALATEAGEEAFRNGGSAVDAALAAAAVLAVVYPHMCAVGGDVMALVAGPGMAPQAVNGSGAAAAAASAERLRAAGAQMPLSGPDTITVPGAVRAWEAMAALGARLPLRDLLAPAIGCARDGVPVAPSLARGIAELAREPAADPGLSAIFLSDGAPLAEGHALRQPALARSLEAIAEQGAGALYSGDVGRALVDGLGALGSPLTMDDLEAHETELVAPLSGRYCHTEVLTAPPNSQGFVLLMILLCLDRLGEVPDPLGAGAALLAELFLLASRDRDAHLADPRHAPPPLDELLGPDHVSRLLDHAGARLEGERPPQPAGVRPTGDTVAVVAADSDGHAVSLIQSLFHSFGSGILEPETGIVCHNRGSFFSLDPASPNVLAPGKRPGHTLMPVVLRRDGRVVGVHGTMGGRAQPQIHAQLLLRVLGMAHSPAAALAAPRWVVGGLDAGTRDDVVLLERSAGDGVAETFRRAGMPVELLAGLDEGVGHGQLARIGQDGTIEAATDPRADGAVAAG